MSLNRLSPEERMILERLRTDPEISFTEQQLQDMLDVELDKPADKMDLALVDEILAVLEPRKATEAEINAGTEKLKQLFRACFQDE